LANVLRAFDEAAFGRSRTLNLRASLPTARDASGRTERWLRQQQMAKAGSVLVITGRGNNSPDGVSAVREAVLRLLPSLRRRGVIKSWREHSPGSLVVELAPVTALFEQMPRRREREAAPEPADPAALQALSPSTRRQLRHLAKRALENLGVRNPEAFVDAEMLKQFAALSVALPEGKDREADLRGAIAVALDELDA
jgi:hypothetical protein